MNQVPDPIAAVAASRKRFVSTGDMSALEESMRLGRSALAALAGSGKREGSAALELSATLGVLYGATRNMGYLDEALELLGLAEQILLPSHVDLAGVYTNMAGARVQRYSVLGRLKDLDAAVIAARQSISSNQDHDRSMAVQYSNVAGILRTRRVMQNSL